MYQLTTNHDYFLINAESVIGAAHNLIRLPIKHSNDQAKQTFTNNNKSSKSKMSNAAAELERGKKK